MGAIEGTVAACRNEGTAASGAMVVVTVLPALASDAVPKACS